MKSLFFFVLIIASALPAGSQQSDPPQASGADWDTTPAALAGQSNRRRPLDERAIANYVSGGISITQMFTDNAELASANQVQDLSYDMEPHIAVNYFTPRLSYDIGVLAGFVVNRNISDRNQATQSAAFDLSYHLTQFVVLRFSDSFRNSTGLWSGVDTAANSSGVGPVQAPNSSLYTYGQFRANTALAELSGQFSPTSFAGVRGTETHTWFPSAATDPVLGSLVGGDTYSAEVFYNHHFTQRNWGGVTLRAERFNLNQSLGHTDTGALLFMYAMNIRPNTSLSFFGGPQLSVTAGSQGISPLPAGTQRRMWSPTGGAVLSSEFRTTTGTISFIHQVTDGGGLASAVTLTSASAEVMRRFGRRFEFGPAFTYAQSAPITPSATIRTYSGQLQSAVRLGDCSFRAGYARDNRSAVGSDASASANRIWVSFSYDFIKPIGR